MSEHQSSSFCQDYYRRRRHSRVLWLCLLAFCGWGLWSLLQAEDIAGALDFEARKLSYAISSEPPDLNHTTSSDSTSIFVLSHVMEGLLRYGPGDELVAGVAERWQLRDDGATFWLRDDARWSDGKPVSAHDFVFAWRQVLNPKTASTYSFLLYPLKNAEAINKGELALESLGVRALDDRTLEVSFAKPCPYFLNLTAFMTYYPLREDFVRDRAERYAAEFSDMLYNGPFVLSRWVHGASLTMTRNPHYWDGDNIWLNEIDIPYITSDSSANFNLFRDNRIALANGLGEAARLQALKQRMSVDSFFDGAVFYLEFNHRPERIGANYHFRKAVQLVLNGEDLVYKVMGQPGTLPASSFFPRWMMGGQDYFSREYPSKPISLSLDKAREHLRLAISELGEQALPSISLLADDSPGGNQAAEYFQSQLKDKLGLDVRVDVQIFKQRIAKQRSGDFDIVMGAWGPDYNDLLTFADLFSSGNANNHGAYQNQNYDHWVEVAQTQVNVKQRMQAFAELQTIIADDAVIIPLYERGITYVQNSRLQGVVRRVIGGDPDFRFATIAEVEK